MLDSTTLDHLRRSHPHYKYPALHHYGLDYLWPEPGQEPRQATYTSFHPALIAGVSKHLAGHNMPAMRADALNAIKNQIQLLSRAEGDAAALWLATHYEVGEQILVNRAAPRPQVQAATTPPAPGATTSQDTPEAAEARAAARALLPKKLGGI